MKQRQITETPFRRSWNRAELELCAPPRPRETEMMRIAYITADPGVPVFGRKGCSIHVQEVLRAMIKHGAQIDLFAANCSGVPAADLAAVRLHPLMVPPKGDLAFREQKCLSANEPLRVVL